MDVSGSKRSFFLVALAALFVRMVPFPKVVPSFQHPALRELERAEGLVLRSIVNPELRSVSLGRGDILEASIAYSPYRPKSEIVVAVERVRDPTGEPHKQSERLMVKLKSNNSAFFSNGTEHHQDMIESIAQKMREHLNGSDDQRSRPRRKVDYGKLVSDVRNLDNGRVSVSEITAHNLSLEFGGSACLKDASLALPRQFPSEIIEKGCGMTFRAQQDPPCSDRPAKYRSAILFEIPRYSRHR